MRKDKYDSFPNEDKKFIEDDSDFYIEEIQIENPNNLANLIDSILIRYDKK
jgi:hypothetical protein